MIEESGVAAGIGAQAARTAGKGRVFALGELGTAERPMPRLETGIAEFDRVTGGGFVAGSVLLLGGEPGIGKSTLLIQACAALALRGERVVYISGEEAMDQVRLRAARLGLGRAAVELAAETGVEDIVATLSHGRRPALVVIDSIQTMWTDTVESSAGTVSQVRGAAQALIRFAKTTGAVVILVGHVTKDGQIAGPRVVEHMVDAVLGFEGEGGRDFRILRAVKNRFGPTDEIGVFEMTGGGLREVSNPSALFLSTAATPTPGAAVFAGMEGTRPLLVEVQAPRRADDARDAPARRRRLGHQPACDDRRGARGPRRIAARPARHLPDDRRGLARRRTGGRSCRRGGARVVPERHAAAGGHRLFR